MQNKYINKYNATKKERKEEKISYANVWLSADINYFFPTNCTFSKNYLHIQLSRNASEQRTGTSGDGRSGTLRRCALGLTPRA